jgi:hypothetical protein
MFKFITNHQGTETTFNTAVLVQYALGTVGCCNMILFFQFIENGLVTKTVSYLITNVFSVDKNITAKLDIFIPHGDLLNVDTRFQLTMPSSTNPLDIRLVIKENIMDEYDVNINTY